MHIVSNQHSAAKNEITVLAIIETLACMITTFHLVNVFGNITHIKYSVLAAPFLLLRNPSSTEKGINLFEKFINHLKDMRQKQGKHYRLSLSSDINTFLVNYFLLLLSGVVALLIKIYSIVTVTIKRPIYSISHIPTNWYRTTLATDFFHPPEIIPGSELDDRIDLKWSILKNVLKEVYKGNVKKIVIILIILPIIALHYIPAYAYRLALKSTSIIYLPFIWVVYKKPKGEKHSKYLIINIRESATERIKRIYACFAIPCLLVLPFLINLFWFSAINSLAAREIIIYFIPITEITSWHISRDMSAILTIAIFFIADQMYIRMKSEWNKKKYDSTILLWLLRIRSLCTYWTIFCGIYLISTSEHIEILRHIEFQFPYIKWFPWEN